MKHEFVNLELARLLDAASVIPVIALEEVEKAAPLANALQDGGCRVAEMTMRTPNALACMQAMKQACPEMIIGMGTLKTPQDVTRVVDTGADFLVSPGLTPALADALQHGSRPALPGVATLSEAMQAREMGFEALKFFPAEQSGGAAWLKSVSGPNPELVFCPTGSISRELALDYLKLPNVACVGGSWVASSKQIANGDWAGITENARLAAELT